MTGRLRLQLLLASHRLAIRADGELNAVTAHLLSKAVVGALRRFPATVLAIDLTQVRAIDGIGEMALADCRREAERRGVIFTIVDGTVPPPTPDPPALGRRNWIRSHPTGTICRAPIKF